MFVQDSIKNGSSWDVFYKPKSKKTVDNSLYNFAKVLTNEVVKKTASSCLTFSPTRKTSRRSTWR